MGKVSLMISKLLKLHLVQCVGMLIMFDYAWPGEVHKDADIKVHI